MYHLNTKTLYNEDCQKIVVLGEIKVIEMVQYDYIRFLYYNQNKSKRAIAREVGVHRNTVTKAIENPEQSYN